MRKRERSESRAPEHDEAIYEEPEVIFVERQFPVVLRWPLIWGLVFILVGMVPWSISTANAYSWQPLAVNWMIVVSLALAGYWVYHFAGWYFTVLILTDQDITFLRQRGFFRRKVTTLTLNNIQSVNYRIPGLQAAMFKFGDIYIETLSGSGHLRLKTYYKPARLQEEILDAMENYTSTGEA
jgi:uncharacterized membrane protein YdbT with pleckstrin-like domain